MNKDPRPNKNLGQHFLKDQNVIEKICQDHPEESWDLTLEIGPGPGALTQRLSEREGEYFVLEKDSRFLGPLGSYLSEEKIILQDALEFDLPAFLRTKNFSENSKIWLVSNLPYNVAAPIFIKFIQYSQIKKLTLMFQKEVAQKIALKDSLARGLEIQDKKNMGPLMILSHTFFNCEYLFHVPPNSFNPPPKVDSGVVSLTRKSSPLVSLEEFKNFEDFLRKLFSQRRKQLQGVLRPYYGKEWPFKNLSSCKISPQVRAEALSPLQIITLYKALQKK